MSHADRCVGWSPVARVPRSVPTRCRDVARVSYDDVNHLTSATQDTPTMLDLVTLFSRGISQ